MPFSESQIANEAEITQQKKIRGRVEYMQSLPKNPSYEEKQKNWNEYVDNLSREELLDHAYQQARETEVDKIEESEFEKLMNSMEYSADKQLVENLKKKFEQRRDADGDYRYGKILETIFNEQTEL